MSITVLIPAYNAQATIERALTSVHVQSLKPDKILIVDDGSAVPLHVPQNLLSPIPLTLMRLERNMGSSAAINHGIEHISTDWIAFLDADDHWHPDKLLRQMALVEKHSDTALVATGLKFLDPNGVSRTDMGTVSFSENPTERFADILAFCHIAKPSVLVRTSVVRAMGGFREDLIVGEDQNMWLRIAAEHRVDLVPDILTYANDTPGSLTKRRDIAPGFLWRYVVEPLFQQHRHKLNQRQIDLVIGARTQQAAVDCLLRGTYGQALRYLWQSSCHGYQRIQNVSYALTPLKKLIKSLTRR